MPLLSKSFVNDLDAEVKCILTKFAEDTKLGHAVNSLERQEALQRDLDLLEHWTIINSTKFNKNKCWFLHLGQNNARHRYRFGDDG